MGSLSARDGEELRRVIRGLRQKPPVGAPRVGQQLGALSKVLDEAGVEPDQRPDREVMGVESALKELATRLRQDSSLVEQFAELVARMDDLARAFQTPGGRAAEGPFQSGQAAIGPPAEGPAHVQRGREAVRRSS